MCLQLIHKLIDYVLFFWTQMIAEELCDEKWKSDNF